jgi:hypothetical protein
VRSCSAPSCGRCCARASIRRSACRPGMRRRRFRRARAIRRACGRRPSPGSLQVRGSWSRWRCAAGRRSCMCWVA